MSYCKPTTREFPFWAMFCLFPFISIITWVTKGQDIVNYDLFWIPFTALLCVYTVFQVKSWSKKYTKYIFLFATLCLLKYVIPIGGGHISLNASLMDGKWFVYLLATALWIYNFGTPRIDRVYRYCIFFCCIYICKALYMIATGTLSRAGVLMEANYDGFMVLMIYCFSCVVKDKKKWWDWLIILTTLLTFSRTGWASLFVIFCYRIFKKNILYLLLLLPIVYFLIQLGADLRGESASNMDRFVYWRQAFLYFEETSLSNVLLGSTPGVALKIHIIPEFAWTVSNFEEMRNLSGVYPFMFHSTYLRLAITWGIFGTLAYLFVFVKYFFKSKYMPLKYLCLITLIQSFSLSALTLQNVSFLLFVLLVMAWNEDYKLRREMKLQAYRLSMSKI